MSNKFVVTSQVKNHIYFDALNNQFKVPKHKLKYFQILFYSKKNIMDGNYPIHILFTNL